jgi:protein-L-isoaspartate(D-aspartate) O-methyltransferase
MVRKSKAIIWAHNSHVGDASATEMSSRGEYNLGHLCLEGIRRPSLVIGFGTNSGTGGCGVQLGRSDGDQSVLPAIPESYESSCHEANIPAFCLDLHPIRPGGFGWIANRV